MEEPSVLDYVKAKLNPRKRNIPLFPDVTGDEDHKEETQSLPSIPEDEVLRPRKVYRLPWRMLVSLFFALGAQSMLEPPSRDVVFAVVFYALAAGFLIWAYLINEWKIPEIKTSSNELISLQIRRGFMWVIFPLIVLAFIAFGGNRFTSFNMLIWGLLIFYFIYALWLPEQPIPLKDRFSQIIRLIKSPQIDLRVSYWTILVIAVLGLAFFFRFYRLSQVPGEMFSDHAEKLTDVGDVLNGQFSIFFPRNTGREAFQMYLTALMSIIFGTGLSFMSLKIGTALCGFLTLPYIYLIGKETGNRWVGLFAMLLAGVAYWPNVIARVALRFTLYPFFVAPVLYYLLRGIRRSNRNDFILSGIALGIGLHGYSPMRIVPFIIVIAIGLYLIHAQSRGKRIQVLAALILLAFMSLIIFLPLLRYMMDDPQMFGYRAFTRLGTSERPFPAPVWLIFLGNLWKSMIMFFWDNGNIWVHSIPGRPALDVVTAGLFFLGFILLAVRYFQKRHWQDLFLLISVPLLMMPSILSLAFPDENPSLNRSGGAYVVVFVIAAIALQSIMSSLYQRANSNWGKVLPVFLGLVLLTSATLKNYDLVFRQFDEQFMQGAWNTSEMGHIIRSFADSVGSLDNAYVVPYPYWVDTRLVGINANYPTKDYALWPENFNDSKQVSGAKLFIVNPEDTTSLKALQDLYPTSAVSLHSGKYPGKDFLVLFVPAEPNQTP